MPPRTRKPSTFSDVADGCGGPAPGMGISVLCCLWLSLLPGQASVFRTTLELRLALWAPLLLVTVEFSPLGVGVEFAGLMGGLRGLKHRNPCLSGPETRQHKADLVKEGGCRPICAFLGKLLLSLAVPLSEVPDWMDVNPDVIQPWGTEAPLWPHSTVPPQLCSRPGSSLWALSARTAGGYLWLAHACPLAPPTLACLAGPAPPTQSTSSVALSPVALAPFSQKSAMPRERSSPPFRGHHLGCLASAPACRAWETRWSSPLLCRDMALQNALYTGDLARLQDLFPPHSTADLLLESRAAEPRWSSHQREECRGQGEPPGDRHTLCARLVEKPNRGSEEDTQSGPRPIVTRTASGPALAFWQAVLAGDTGSVSRILADSSTSLAPDSIFDTSDPERWRDFRFNIRALRLWSLTYEEELTTPLHVAASRGHTEVLQLLLRRRARPDSAPGGRTALHEACAAGHPACVHVLLVAGADPNVPDQDGKRPLHLCRGAGTLQCAELLLRFGAQVDGRSEEEEETPLHVAARLGHVELADLLLRRGASPDARNAEGWTPLLAACDMHCQSPADAEATTTRCFQLCRLLLSAGADADAADQDKQRPLHLACRHGHAAVVELLLSCGVSANAMDYGGHTALHCALQGPATALARSPEQVVRALLNHGAVRVWPGALPKVLERWCTSPRTIEVLVNTYSVLQLPEEAMGLVPPEILQKHQRFYSSLFALVRQPRSLQHLSRCVLRAHLAGCLPHALPRLPLPPRLLCYLQLDFEDVLY